MAREVILFTDHQIYQIKSALVESLKEDKKTTYSDVHYSSVFEKKIRDLGFNEASFYEIRDTYGEFISVIESYDMANWLKENYEANIGHSSLLHRLLSTGKLEKEPKCALGYGWWQCPTCRKLTLECPETTENEKIESLFNSIKSKVKAINRREELKVDDLLEDISKLEKIVINQNPEELDREKFKEALLAIPRGPLPPGRVNDKICNCGNYQPTSTKGRINEICKNCGGKPEPITYKQ